MMMMMMMMMIMMIVLPASAISIPGHRKEVLDSLRRQLGKHYYPTKAQQGSHDLADNLCVVHSILALVSTQSWSNTMWDASGKVSDGVGLGATEARGDPHLCLSVSVALPGTLTSHLHHYEAQLASHNLTLQQPLQQEVLLQQDTFFRGKYCLVTLRKEDSVGQSGGSWQAVSTMAGRYQHTYGTCVPHTCTTHFLQEWLQQQQQETGTSLTVTCHDDSHHHTWTRSDLSFL
nr:uncharacterized protein LOC128701658 [Cherax quadricarinatus]